MIPGSASLTNSRRFASLINEPRVTLKHLLSAYVVHIALEKKLIDRKRLTL